MAKTPASARPAAAPRYARATALGQYHNRRVRPGEVLRVKPTDKRLAKWMEPITEAEFLEAQGGRRPAPTPPRVQQIDHQFRPIDKNAPVEPDAADDAATGDQDVLS